MVGGRIRRRPSLVLAEDDNMKPQTFLFSFCLVLLFLIVIGCCYSLLCSHCKLVTQQCGCNAMYSAGCGLINLKLGSLRLLS